MDWSPSQESYFLHQDVLVAVLDVFCDGGWNLRMVRFFNRSTNRPGHILIQIYLNRDNHSLTFSSTSSGSKVSRGSSHQQSLPFSLNRLVIWDIVYLKKEKMRQKINMKQMNTNWYQYISETSSVKQQHLWHKGIFINDNINRFQNKKISEIFQTSSQSNASVHARHRK